MTCCHCQAVDIQFSPKAAQADLKRYSKKGPDKTTLQLIEAVRAANLTAACVLDVGGGIGVIHHELLGVVADTAIHVEASRAYLDEAQAESERRGNGERVRFVHGDLVDLESELPDCDVVTLDRVICCYPDLEPLIAASTRKAKALWAASYPRDRWWTRAGVLLQNLLRRLTGNRFRTYVHSTERLEEIVTNLGFTPTFKKVGFIWETTAYERQEAERPAFDPK